MIDKNKIEMAQYNLACLVSMDTDMIDGVEFENLVENHEGGEYWYEVNIQDLAGTAGDIIAELMAHIASLRTEVRLSTFASCTCVTKTPEVKAHKDGCGYKRKKLLLADTKLKAITG